MWVREFDRLAQRCFIPEKISDRKPAMLIYYELKSL